MINILIITYGVMTSEKRRLINCFMLLLANLNRRTKLTEIDLNINDIFISCNIFCMCTIIAN